MLAAFSCGTWKFLAHHHATLLVLQQDFFFSTITLIKSKASGLLELRKPFAIGHYFSFNGTICFKFQLLGSVNYHSSAHFCVHTRMPFSLECAAWDPSMKTGRRNTRVPPKRRMSNRKSSRGRVSAHAILCRFQHILMSGIQKIKLWGK